MVGLLALAHDRACEAELAHAIEADLDAGVLPDLDRLLRPLQARATQSELPSRSCRLAAYDDLAVVRDEAVCARWRLA